MILPIKKVPRQLSRGKNAAQLVALLFSSF